MDLVGLIFPRKCLGCGKEGKYLCSDCVGKAKRAKPVCPYCERPSIDGMTHTKCTHRFGLDGLISIWEYDGAVRKAILALKYKYATEIVKELSVIFLEILKTHNSLFIIHDSCVLAPIPLHWYRENWRGFNQSEEIGKLIAKEMGWKFIPDLLIRRKLTTPQTELKADERSENIRGVFSLSPSILISQYPNILLFDDVWTTGSTMKEAAKVLKRAGAERVWGLTIAR